MPSPELIGLIAGFVILLPISALVGKFVTFWIARFRVGYLRMLASTSLAYAITWGVGFVVITFGAMTAEVSGLRLVAGWGILACCHINLLRSPAGDRLSPIKSIFIAALQIIGGIVAFSLVLLLAVAVKKIVA